MLNRVTIMGRLTADPEYRTTAAETAVASIRLAVDRDYKNKETGERPTDFFNVTAWRGLADWLARYTHKGSQIVVDGRLELQGWTDQDGKKCIKVVIVAEKIYFADAKKKEEDPHAPADSPEEPMNAEDFPDNRPFEGATEP